MSWCQGCRQFIRSLDLYTYWTISGCCQISTKLSKGAANQKRLANTAFACKFKSYLKLALRTSGLQKCLSMISSVSSLFWPWRFLQLARLKLEQIKTKNIFINCISERLLGENTWNKFSRKYWHWLGVVHKWRHGQGEGVNDFVTAVLRPFL